MEDSTTSPGLLALPPEVLEIIIGYSSAEELLVLGCTSRALSVLTDADSTWLHAFETRFEPVVRILYHGEVPEPEEGKSWKEHYRLFDASWMASPAHGAVLLTIHGHVYDVTGCASPVLPGVTR